MGSSVKIHMKLSSNMNFINLWILLFVAYSESLWTCDEILGDSLCDLTVVEETVKMNGVDMFYWVYQKSSPSEASDSQLPVIMINGGPGFPHNYLLPLKQMACSGRKIYFL
eukprot:TRINITY_DN7080_c0_g1_i1.p1 TRINITY_DN7080_c0_g1~~TRINITY_DN7080_c0_g1_i1.p1  ORF type:complete len:119 (-),score=34.45 TRINITY_DN7080_c0_g1_i1:397-729(-)